MTTTKLDEMDDDGDIVSKSITTDVDERQQSPAPPPQYSSIIQYPAGIDDDHREMNDDALLARTSHSVEAHRSTYTGVAPPPAYTYSTTLPTATTVKMINTVADDDNGDAHVVVVDNDTTVNDDVVADEP